VKSAGGGPGGLRVAAGGGLVAAPGCPVRSVCGPGAAAAGRRSAGLSSANPGSEGNHCCLGTRSYGLKRPKS